MKKVIYRFLGCMLFCFVIMTQRAEASETEFKDEWKNGIVEVNAGVTDSEGEFHTLKHASGFLITNNEQDTYIITTRSTVSISNEEKNGWMQENGIADEMSNYSVNTSIRVVVKGDVSSEVTIVNQSENENFVILKSESVIQEKDCLKIGNSDELKGDEIVYSLGFPEQFSENSNAKYTKDEVAVQKGKISNLSLGTNDVDTIMHYSTIDTGELGGPLLDQNGYVIGLNQKIDGENAGVYALPIRNIKDILDSYGIEYGSEELDQAYENLQNLCDKGNQMLGERYKKKSLTDIKTELEAAQSVLESNTYDMEEITSEADKLEGVLDQAVPKMEEIYIVIIGLGGVIAAIAIYLLIISVKEKKLIDGNLQNSSTKPQKENIQYHHNQNMKQKQEERRTEKISSNKRKEAFLQRVTTGERIIFEEESLIIGKSANHADYAIQGNKTISRVHAKIQKVGEYYVIADMDSSNGTFVNGKRISGNGTRLRNQDKVRLSNEEFVFKEI